MKILIFGASGMLGHRLMIQLSKYHEVYGTVRSENFILPSIDSDHNIIPMIYFPSINGVNVVLSRVKPDVVINCIAAIPQCNPSQFASIHLNALLPMELAIECWRHNARLVHFSTDAVFSGKRGNYTEDDEPDGNDTYALTKRLGEISDQDHVLTLRCCPIGRELSGAHSLVEWFLSGSNSVHGYTGARFSPLSGHEIARVLETYILPRTDLHGMFHLSGWDTNKFTLLSNLAHYYQHQCPIEPIDSVQIDRTLNGTRFQQVTGWKPANFFEMYREMAADNALYEKVAI